MKNRLCVLSRNKFLTTNEYVLSRDREVMKKLNNKRLRWIIREMRRGEQSAYRIAKQQNVTSRYVRMLHKRYLNLQGYLIDKIRLQKCGRKPKPVTRQEVEIVKEVTNEFGFGAVMAEKILAERGIRIPHNRIHKILVQEGLAKNEYRKSRRRKWIRYQRRHSNSLWHTDWMEHRKIWYILYEDDASRLITGHGEFKTATADSSILTFEEAAKKWGTPKQVISDHGSQFCEDEEKIYRFREYLKSKGVDHILARVKHPQTNGKLEKLNHTMQKLIDRFGNLDDAVKFYNEKRPHMSLENGHLRTPLEAFYDKKRNN